MSSLKPESVFTPKTIVTREMFARRNESDLDGMPGLQDTLQDALREKGGQILLYGDTGVGKSSLLQYAAEDEGLGIALVECTSAMSFSDIVDSAVRQVVSVREISFKKSRSAEGAVSGEGSVPWMAKLTASFRATGGKETQYEVVEKSAIDVLWDLLPKAGKNLIVLDNFQNVKSVDTRELVVQTMEQFSDRAARAEGSGLKIVVVGIAEDAQSLLGESRSYSRRTTEIGVPRMPDDEILEIFERGFGKLGITVSEDLYSKFAFYSDGFPYFAHLLGLNVARAVLRSSDRSVSPKDLSIALLRSAKGVTGSYSERTRKARESGGEVKPRSQIMDLLARSDRRDWSSTDVQGLWAESIDNRSDYAFLHVALGQLITEKHGRILKRTGARKHYLYQFEDPHMRPYLRITAGVDL